MTGPGEGLAPVMQRNIEALVERRREADRARSRQDRLADVITRFAGSMRSVVLHGAVFGAWVVLNAGLTPLEPFDPSFVILATVASVEAIFLSTFVLISQNGMTRHADERADLDLQISLLSEHEITRLVTLVTAMADKMDIEQAREPELAELARDVAPERVLDEIDSNHEKA